MQYDHQHNGKKWGMLLILLCAAGSMAGCKKMVDAGEPKNTITTDRAFSTNALANAALAGVFSQLMTNTGSMIFSNGATTIYAGLSADELENFAGTLNLFDNQFFTNQILIDNPAPNSYIWQPAYKIIYNCNGAIEGIAASTSTLLTDSVRKVLTGEAKFVRAFCYFYLTNLFGDVPLVLTTDYTQTVSMARTPQATVYNQIVQDLADARELLQKDYSTAAGERIRPNKWAATALLARVYLYQQNWAAAEAAASEVIANSQYSILSDLNKVFLLNSQETIWQLQQNNTKSPRNVTWDGLNFVPTFRWSTFPAATQFVFSNPATFNTSATFFIPPYFFSKQMAEAFEPGDKRKTTWTDSVPSPAASNYLGRVYYFPFKYTSSTGTIGGAITQYYMVLRLAEQYLIRAEARAQQGTNLTGAASDLNVLRTRAGLVNTTAATQTDLLTAVARERRTELFAEWGHRWFDLKRRNAASTVLSSITNKQPWSDNSLLYPIPTLEITNNHNLVQNTGY